MSWLSEGARVIRRIKSLAVGGGQMREVTSGAAVAFFLRASGAAFSFGFSLLLARLVGAGGAGIYYLSFTMLMFATVLGRLGLDNALLRFVAVGAEKRDWGSVAGLYRLGIRISVGASLFATLLLLAGAPWISRVVFSEPALGSPLRIMALSILPMSLLILHGQLLRGLKRVREALTVYGLGVPLVSVVLLAILGGSLGVRGAAAAYAAATVIVLVLGIVLWRRATPQLRGVRGGFDTRLLVKTSIPLLWIASANLAMNWTDTVMLGIFASSQEVGVYGVAMRTAALLTFLITAFTSVVSPRFAELYARGDLDSLGDLARRSTRLLALLALPPLLVFAVFPAQILGVFGPEFRVGAAALAVLAAGQFVNVACGLVGYLLIMCGFEKVARNNVALGLGLNVALNLLLIPEYGVLGAAIATATALAVKNLAAVYLVRRYLSISVWSR